MVHVSGSEKIKKIFKLLITRFYELASNLTLSGINFFKLT